MQKAWQDVDLLEAIERAIIGERVGGSELWAMLRQPNGVRAFSSVMGPPARQIPTTSEALERFASEHFLIPLYKMSSIDEDELFFLQSLQENLDSVRRLRTRQPWRIARQGLEQSFARLNRAANSYARFRYWLTLQAMPNFARAENDTVRAETERRLTVTAIALKRYQLEHSAPPASLDSLVPAFLPAVPLDPMSGSPLRYRVPESGACILYSTGEDGADDGGDATNPSGKDFGMWNGRDAVWPAAVAPPAKP
jgi:hypothetical protein